MPRTAVPLLACTRPPSAVRSYWLLPMLTLMRETRFSFEKKPPPLRCTWVRSGMAPSNFVATNPVVQARTIEAYVLRGELYHQLGNWGMGETACSEILPAFAVPVTDVVSEET